MASSVEAASFWSGTLPPFTATANGAPRPSISVERLTPSLLRAFGQQGYIGTGVDEH